MISKLLLTSALLFYAFNVLSQNPLTVNQSASTSMTDALKSSLAIHSNIKKNSSPKFQTSSWLAASPSAEFSFLKGQQEFQNDEIEVNLNLAIKSNFHRNIDQKLVTLDKEIKIQSTRLNKLFFSGLIRESVWGFKIAQTQQVYIERKESILHELKNNQLKLNAAGESSDYALLLIKKEINKAQIDSLSRHQELTTWMQQYHQITGLNKIPNNAVEETMAMTNVTLTNHPKAQILDRQWQQKSLSLQVNGNESMPWNLSLAAKSTKDIDTTNEQIGLAVEIPITFIKANSQSATNEWRQSKTQFDLDFRTLLLKLNHQLERLKSERDLLIEKERLLKDSVNLSQQIMKQMDRLNIGNEMSQEMVLRQVLEAIQTESDYAMIKILREQNNAMIRQAAGITL